MRERATGGPGASSAWEDKRHFLGPALLAPNPIPRFYTGGARIARLRGSPDAVAGAPEDWVGSTTTTFGDQSLGLGRLIDGKLVRDAIASDPMGFLGQSHVRRWGSNPALLVKLLDAGERLPVHFHPGRAFASEALGLEFGKTEAWIIVDAEPDAVIHLGLARAVERAELEGWLADQDVASMLGAMHPLPVRPGDAFFVPAGTLHAIGTGILMVELQEPTDLSIVIEWERLGIPASEATLGLGWDRVLDAVELSPTAPVHPRSGELLPPAAAAYFGARLLEVGGDPLRLGPTFAILIALDGNPAVSAQGGFRLELARGQAALVGYGAGPVTIDGHGTVICCLPPDPDAEEPLP